MLCYNTSPFPDITDKEKELLNQYAFDILDNRASHAGKTMAWMYNPNTMPLDLRQAHQALDEAIEKCYRLQPFQNDTESTNPKILEVDNLYRIGFSSAPVEERIKNAKYESTYLFADVKLLESYKVYNWNADKLELFLHKFFANACLDIEIENTKGQYIKPREWFIVPFGIIQDTIKLVLNENIFDYKYDEKTKTLKFKK